MSSSWVKKLLLYVLDLLLFTPSIFYEVNNTSDTHVRQQQMGITKKTKRIFLNKA